MVIEAPPQTPAGAALHPPKGLAPLESQCEGFDQKSTCVRQVFIRMFTNFGREIVFSAYLCYNEANKKPLPKGEVAARPTERDNARNSPLTRYRGSSPKRRAYRCARASLKVWDFLVPLLYKGKLAIKRNYK